MLSLPERTEISKSIYKKDLLLRFNGTTVQKQKFNEEIESVKIVNELSKRSLSIPEGKDIKGIFVILVELKTDDISQSTINTIFDLIHQKIIAVFRFEDKIKLAIKEEKIFLSEWQDSSYKLTIEGLNLDDIWKSFIEVIGNITISEEQTLKDAVQISIKNDKLDKEITALEKKMRNTKTPAKKFDLYNKIQELKNKKE